MEIKDIVSSILSGVDIMDALSDKEETTTSTNVGAYAIPMGNEAPSNPDDDDDDEDEVVGY